MRSFPAYTVAILFKTPYCHIMPLYNLAIRAEDLDKIVVATGIGATKDRAISESLSYINSTISTPDADKMREVMSDDNKRKAQEIADRIIKGKKNV